MGGSCREPDINVLLNNCVTQEHSPAAPPRPAPALPLPGEANQRLQESQNDCNQEYLKQFLIVYQLAAETQKV